MADILVRIPGRKSTFNASSKELVRLKGHEGFFVFEHPDVPPVIVELVEEPIDNPVQYKPQKPIE